MGLAEQDAYRTAHTALTDHLTAMNVDHVVTPEEAAAKEPLSDAYTAAAEALSSEDWLVIDAELAVRFDQAAAAQSCSGVHAG